MNEELDKGMNECITRERNEWMDEWINEMNECITR